jgi:hypothetical protein
VGIPVEKKKALEQIKRYQGIVNNALSNESTVGSRANGIGGNTTVKSVNGGGSVINYATCNGIDDFEIPFEVRSDRVGRGENEQNYKNKQIQKQHVAIV